LSVFRCCVLAAQLIAEGLHVRDGHAQEIRRLLRPSDPEEPDERHDILAIGALGVDVLPARHPRLRRY
jgi:hypothetical protein